MKRFLLAGLLIVSFCFLPAPASAEEGVQLRPLLYRESLDAGQQKRGVLDVANPTKEKVVMQVTVKLFRQKNDDGKLEFYEKPDVTVGIVPEYTEFELGPKDALQLAFTVDGNKLPQGDVLAAIFVKTKDSIKAGKPSINPSVEAGTLLILQNGKAGPRTVEIASLDVPLLQFGELVRGTASIKNPASDNRPSGFFPQIKVRIEPWGAKKEFEAPLVYVGRTRTFDFSLPSDQFGVYKVVFSANNATSERYIFVMTGKWRYLVPLGFVLILVAGGAGIWWRRRRYSAIRVSKR